MLTVTRGAELPLRCSNSTYSEGMPLPTVLGLLYSVTCLPFWSVSVTFVISTRKLTSLSLVVLARRTMTSVVPDGEGGIIVPAEPQPAATQVPSNKPRSAENRSREGLEEEGKN